MSTHRMAVQRTNEAVPLAILGGCDGSFGLDNRVDTADCILRDPVSRCFILPPASNQWAGMLFGMRTSVGDLSRDLEEEVVLDVSCSGCHCVIVTCSIDAQPFVSRK